MKELHRPAFLWMPKAMLREAKSWRKQTIPHTKLKIKQNKICLVIHTQVIKLQRKTNGGEIKFRKVMI